MKARLNAHADRICDDMFDHAAQERTTADNEFLDEMHDFRLELDRAKEDKLDELNRAFDDKLEEFREGVTELAAECSERAYVDACQKLDMLVEVTALLKRGARAGEGRSIIRRKVAQQGRRASSLPLSVG